mmetsp:Transcript_43320/g.139202  ORF Transcript_43320/g.139202 Transcript_43320/m.139202 type:complete len:343 (-) Transcript_43320:8-1036(-)
MPRAKQRTRRCRPRSRRFGSSASHGWSGPPPTPPPPPPTPPPLPSCWSCRWRGPPRTPAPAPAAADPRRPPSDEASRSRAPARRWAAAASPLPAARHWLRPPPPPRPQLDHRRRPSRRMLASRLGRPAPSPRPRRPSSPPPCAARPATACSGFGGGRASTTGSAAPKLRRAAHPAGEAWVAQAASTLARSASARLASGRRSAAPAPASDGRSRPRRPLSAPAAGVAMWRGHGSRSGCSGRCRTWASRHPRGPSAFQVPTRCYGRGPPRAAASGPSSPAPAAAPPLRPPSRRWRRHGPLVRLCAGVWRRDSSYAAAADTVAGAAAVSAPAQGHVQSHRRYTHP